MPASHFGQPILRVLGLAVSVIASATPQPTLVVRWSADQPRCAFQAADDGSYRYAMATDDFVVTLAMDAQELDKARRRVEPILGLFLSVRFLKENPPALDPGKISLEFVRHFHATEAPLDRLVLAARLQADDKKTAQSAAREVRKHPEKKDEIEAALKVQQENTSQTIGWARAQSLQSASPQSREASGWLLFAAKTRWIGDLARQEEFLLRIPLGQVVVEFPFTLPPSQDDIRLRTRAADRTSER